VEREVTADRRRREELEQLQAEVRAAREALELDPQAASREEAALHEAIGRATKARDAARATFTSLEVEREALERSLLASHAHSVEAAMPVERLWRRARSFAQGRLLSNGSDAPMEWAGELLFPAVVLALLWHCS